MGSKTGSRITPALHAIALTAGLFIVGAAVGETPPPPPTAAGLPDLSAELQTTLIDLNGHRSLSTVHILRSGQSVRYEHNNSDPPEVWIMDFKEMKEYRIYSGDKIYFDTPISARLSLKAQREGLIPEEDHPELIETRFLLREDRIDGHPCDIVLLVRSIKDRKDLGKDYTLRWEARDLNGQTLRIAYFEPNSTLAVIDLQAVQTGPVDPGLLQPPSGFASMSPY
ncbi:MAG TPA: hypothetical protein VMN77_05190 [Nitrospiria bacterium]|jgi:hypothetical protein|nr:hypothetical protein [Nitrospiria bacterium]